MRLERLYLRGDMREVRRDLRYQDRVRAPGNARRQRDMAGVPPHHFQHHHPVVACRGRLEVVERLGRRRDGAGMADGGFGRTHVVVDRLGDADQADAALLRQPAQNREAAVAADADQRIQPQLPVALDDLPGPVDPRAVGHRIVEGVALVGRAQHGSAPTKQLAGKAVGVQHLVLQGPGQQAERAFLDADHGPAAVSVRVQRHSPDGGVQPGAVAAAGQDSDAPYLAHRSRLCYKWTGRRSIG